MIFGSYIVYGQCLTNSLVINTGYDPVTGLAIPGGANGATPVPDPHWTATGESPSIAIAISGPGYTEVALGANADIVTTIVGSWASDPVGTPGGWISCINSNTYTTDGTCLTGTPYNMTLTRPFRNCTDDSIKLDLWIANDNYFSSIDVDGILTPFSQPAVADPTNFNTFKHYTETLFLAAGTHHINIVVNNYNDVFVESNPTGLNVYGTVSSSTGINSLVSESYLSCATYPCTSICNAVNLPDTLHHCAGDVTVLPAVMTGTDSVLSITWSPATGLSSTTILTPTLTVGTTSSYYDITLQSLNPFNLVVNGDFSAGNVGFTSSYTYVTGPGSLVPEGVYTITTDPFLEHPGAVSFGDHTTGTGEMMAINGAGTPISVWCETIPVIPNTNYDFSAWMANWSTADVGTGAPILQFMINGILIGTPYTMTAAPGIWTNFFTVWNSGVNTTAAICIFDENTAADGNDFALDDISFNQICVAKDSVYIDVKVPDTTSDKTDTTLCIASSPLTLNAHPGYTSYLWNTGATTSSISAFTSGTYWVQNINHCVVLVDTFNVNYIPLPTVFLGSDTAFCVGNSLVLSSPQPPGSTYLWSNGSAGTSITVSTSGTYWLQVNNGYCVAADSIHVLVSPFPIVDLGPDTFNCNAAPITLQSSYSYTAPSYLWSTGSITPSIVVSVTGTYWLQVTVGGCPGADTVNVTIIYDTFSLANRDTAICRGASIPVFLNANPGATFQWLPTAGIPNSTIPSPAITPDTSAMYHVVISLSGCPDILDSFYIDVQPNPFLFAGGNRTVCQFDTLHLSASITPNWYTHYIYTWSPTTYLDDPTKSTVVYTAGTDTKYYLTVTTPAGCNTKDSASITVYPGNFATMDTSFSICPHDSVQLVPSGGVSYSWHPGPVFKRLNLGYSMGTCHHIISLHRDSHELKRLP